jgi:hypothetical protein
LRRYDSRYYQIELGPELPVPSRSTKSYIFGGSVEIKKLAAFPQRSFLDNRTVTGKG